MHSMCYCSGSKACADAAGYLFADHAGGETPGCICELLSVHKQMMGDVQRVMRCRASLVFKRCSRSRRGCSACLVFLISCSFFSPQTILRQQHQQQRCALRGGVLTLQRSRWRWLDFSFKKKKIIFVYFLYLMKRRNRKISLTWYWFVSINNFWLSLPRAVLDCISAFPAPVAIQPLFALSFGPSKQSEDVLLHHTILLFVLQWLGKIKVSQSNMIINRNCCERSGSVLAFYPFY